MKIVAIQDIQKQIQQYLQLQKSMNLLKLMQYKNQEF